ncbi:MAG: 4-hydroxythreonine-4-phosphate dehydrogenase PdxA [Deltaproteobacteria bacterium]|nr:MAG: 4-hydroxythreonine-4-phosphate dehydrogenase PdxA [Deltaproteobacteria bacterium]
MLVVTPGMGIGPEVTLRALAARPELWRRVVLAGRAAAVRQVEGVDVPLVPVDRLAPADRGVALWDAPDDDEPAEVAAIRAGARACLRREATALVTGPIHKARLVARGFAFSGHTDFLAHLCGDLPPVMAFHGSRFGVALVTTHVPLSRVPDLVRPARVRFTVRTAALAWRDLLGVSHPRIAVCGLNPHAGEGGVLGTEDRDHVAPACADLRAEGWQVEGPVSAETAFHEAIAGHVDIVVAMYHDQGLAPLKAVDFGRAVNWTLGLPIVRTSVDHGTADHLVGTGSADPSSMGAALDLAVRITTPRG